MIKENYKQNVLAIIFDKWWKILLWKYNSEFPSWTFPKWWIKINETKEQALFREIYEELWIHKEKLNILYAYPQTFKKKFTKKEIDWKIKNKWESNKWKEENIFVLKFNWDSKDIDLTISNEFIDWKLVSLNEIDKYIKNKELLNFIDIDFLERLIIVESVFLVQK